MKTKLRSNDQIIISDIDKDFILLAKVASKHDIEKNEKYKGSEVGTVLIDIEIIFCSRDTSHVEPDAMFTLGENDIVVNNFGRLNRTKIREENMEYFV